MVVVGAKRSCQILTRVIRTRPTSVLVEGESGWKDMEHGRRCIVLLGLNRACRKTIAQVMLLGTSLRRRTLCLCQAIGRWPKPFIEGLASSATEPGRKYDPVTSNPFARSVKMGLHVPELLEFVAPHSHCRCMYDPGACCIEGKSDCAIAISQTGSVGKNTRPDRAKDILVFAWKMRYGSSHSRAASCHPDSLSSHQWWRPGSAATKQLVAFRASQCRHAIFVNLAPRIRVVSMREQTY